MTTPTPKPPRKPTPVEKKEASERGLVEITRTFSFITPLFGGGVWVNPDENQRQCKDCDPITLARGNAIRGQLRFWWRATHGLRPPPDGGLHNLETLREREDVLWGNASLPSQVNLRLKWPSESPLKRGPTVNVFEMSQNKVGNWNPRAVEGKGDLAYATFPLQPKAGLRDKLEPGTLREVEGSAELLLTCPSDKQKEVEDAVDAWLTFGGLGGRTRRGFGALQAKEPQDPEALLKRLQEGLEPISGVAGLAQARLCVRSNDPAPSTGLAALQAGLQKLRLFRQGEGIARTDRKTTGNPYPGRSWWPEAESLRRLTKTSDPSHEDPLVGLGDVFPRAAFGMPIIFHFKDKGGGHPPKPPDPPDRTLVPVCKERRASPLIIRPFPQDDGYAVMALVLHDPAAQGENCVLKEQPQAGVLLTQLTPADAQKLTSKPHPLPLNNQTDVLNAFLDYFLT